MNEIKEIPVKKKVKPTNYQRLYRNAKVEARVNHNFAEHVIEAAQRIMLDKKIKQDNKDYDKVKKYVIHFLEVYFYFFGWELGVHCMTVGMVKNFMTFASDTFCQFLSDS